MKLFKGPSLLIIATALLFAAVSQARPVVTATLDITSRPRVSHPRPAHPLAFKSNVKPPQVGEDPDHPVILDKYDYLEAIVPNSPNLQWAFNHYNSLNADDLTKVDIDLNEEVYIFAYNLVFDRWGAPCTDEGQFNSFLIEPTTFAFQGVDISFISNMGIYSNVQPELPYRDDLDPTCLKDENDNIVDLQDGAIVDLQFYIAFKSECLLDLSEKSPLCPAYRMNNPSFNYALPQADSNLITAFKYSVDPKQGGTAEEVFPFTSDSVHFQTAPDLGVLVIKFKAP